MALLTIAETAERLNTSDRHVRELIARRDLSYLKVGRLVRIDTDDLDAWLEAHRVEPTTAGAA